jgi:hypothetical protein
MEAIYIWYNVLLSASEYMYVTVLTTLLRPHTQVMTQQPRHTFQTKLIAGSSQGK